MITMAGNTNTTIVNAAFLQEVKDSNLRLWAVLHQLHELNALRRETDDARSQAHELVALMSELRDSIALEFSLEETYGFIEGASRAGGLGMPDAGLAKIQHRELYLQLTELCEQVEEAQYRGTIARDLQSYLDSFTRFDEAFYTHEEFESELMRCAFGVK